MRMFAAVLLVFSAPAWAQDVADRYPVGTEVAGLALALDGDTLDLWPDGLDGDRVRVRLHGISAPEMGGFDDAVLSRAALDYLIAGQPDGDDSTYPLGTVTCVVSDHHRGRLVARCDGSDGDLGMEMLATGMAVTYRAFLDPTDETDRHYMAMEAAAAFLGHGHWRRLNDGFLDIISGD